MEFIDDELVLFKDYTMLELKTMFYSLPKGASGGGDLPRGYASLKKAIDLHRHYTSIKLSNAPKDSILKGRISIDQYKSLSDIDKIKYGRYCGSDEVYYILL